MPRDDWLIVKPIASEVKFGLFGVGSTLDFVPGTPKGEQLVLTPQASDTDGRWMMFYDVDGYRAIKNGRLRFLTWINSGIGPVWTGAFVHAQGNTEYDYAYLVLVTAVNPMGDLVSHEIQLYKMPVGGPSVRCSPADFPTPLGRWEVPSSFTLGSNSIPIFNIEIYVHEDLVSSASGLVSNGTKIEIYQNHVGADVDLGDLIEAIEDAGGINSNMFLASAAVNFPNLLTQRGVSFTQAWDLVGEYTDTSAGRYTSGRFGIVNLSYVEPIIHSTTASQIIAGGAVQNSFSFYPAQMGISALEFLSNCRIILSGGAGSPKNNGVFEVSDIGTQTPYYNNLWYLGTSTTYGTDGSETAVQNPVTVDVSNKWIVGFDSIELFIESVVSEDTEPLFIESFEPGYGWPWLESAEEVLFAESF